MLYLNPNVPADCGTAFYRQRLPMGQRGGNIAPPPHANLVEALGTRFVPPDSFVEDLVVPYRYNTMLLYHSNLIHSATRYCGDTPVSYTHLDVYKRQTPRRGPARCRPSACRRARRTRPCKG